MTTDTIAAFLRQLRSAGTRGDVATSWTPRSADARVRALEAPRRISLFGPALQPKTVPIRRSR